MAYDDYLRKLKKKRDKSPDTSDIIKEWRKKWRGAGPVKFAENVLECPKDVPPHPDLGRIPEKIILNHNQKEFLTDLWKRPKEQLILVAGRGAGKCIAGDSYIFTNKGMIKIRDLFNDKKEIVKKEIDIASKNGIEKTSHRYYGGQEKVIKIKTKKGLEITGTYEHPLQIINKRDELEFKRLDELSVGDFVTINRGTNLFSDNYVFIDGIKIDEKIGRLIGYLIADGCMTDLKNDGGTFGFSNYNEEVINDIENLLNYVTNKLKIKSIELDVGDNQITRKVLRQFLYKVGLDFVYAKGKKVPSSILKSPKSVILEFLRGYFEGDGTIENKKNVSCSSASKQLMRQIQLLCINLGMVPTLCSKIKKYNGEKQYSLLFTSTNVDLYRKIIGFLSSDKKDRLEKTRRSFRCSKTNQIPYIRNKIIELREKIRKKQNVPLNQIRYKTSRVKILENITYQRLGKILESMKYPEFKLYKHLKTLYEKNYYYDRVVSIEYINKGREVFDLTVPESHSFTANGIINHNTMCIAMYVCWRICCFDFFTITVMGGAMMQSTKIKEFIDFWRLTGDNVNYCLHRSLTAGAKPAQVHSRWGSYARFSACSEAGARGPHVTQVFVDEVSTGESKNKQGARAVRAIRGQLQSSANSLLVYTSTANFILGTFYKTWSDARRLGWKRYRWSTGKYYKDKEWYITDKDGDFVLDEQERRIPDWDYIDSVLVKDRVKDHWKSNCWWIKDKDIQNYRINSSNDEFLVEVLGGISKGSGLVFGRDDLETCICDGSRWTKDGSKCKQCRPYTEHCPMMEALGLKKNMISNRKMGVDFGETAPNAATITGKRGKYVFVLYNDERAGSMRTDDIIQWVVDKSDEFGVWEIFADPEERAMLESIENRGKSTPNIWKMGGGVKKNYYAKNLVRMVEQRHLIIPIKFQYVIQSLDELAYDDRGKIRKHNDHSFDSLIYSCVDYELDQHFAEFWKVKDRDISIW